MRTASIEIIDLRATSDSSLAGVAAVLVIRLPVEEGRYDVYRFDEALGDWVPAVVASIAADSAAGSGGAASANSPLSSGNCRGDACVRSLDDDGDGSIETLFALIGKDGSPAFNPIGGNRHVFDPDPDGESRTIRLGFADDSPLQRPTASTESDNVRLAIVGDSAEGFALELRGAGAAATAPLNRTCFRSRTTSATPPLSTSYVRFRNRDPEIRLLSLPDMAATTSVTLLQGRRRRPVCAGGRDSPPGLDRTRFLPLFSGSLPPLTSTCGWRFFINLPIKLQIWPLLVV